MGIENKERKKKTTTLDCHFHEDARVDCEMGVVPFGGEAGCVGIGQQTELVTLLKQHAEAVATRRRSTRDL